MQTMQELQWFHDMLKWARENGLEVSVAHLGNRMVEITLVVKDDS